MKIPKDMQAGVIHKTKNNGNLKIIRFISRDNVEVEFIVTAYKTKATSTAIRKGLVKDNLHKRILGIGFIGIGSHRSYSDGSPNHIYQCWSGMIHRCYDTKYRKTHPTYSECEVCDEWHNFQNFADWYVSNQPDDDKKYQLDKDILSDSCRGKLYSPKTCLLVSLPENCEASFAKVHKFISPDGREVEIYNLKKFCRENGLNPGCMSRVKRGIERQHKGWTKSKAGTEK